MNFLETSKTISQQEISKIEQKLDLSFPKDFIQHYLKFNGGYPEKRNYRWNDEDYTRINCFFSLKYEGFGNMEEVYIDLVLSKGYLPEGFVPFATDDGGNFFCISAIRNDNGSIYYINNDHYDPESSESMLKLLNNNFHSFLDRLS